MAIFSQIIASTAWFGLGRGSRGGLLAVWIWLGAPALLPAAIEGPVQIEGGLVLGVAGDSPEVRVFKGVPYAAPPLGDLRWRPPSAVVAWPGVRRADRFSPSAM